MKSYSRRNFLQTSLGAAGVALTSKAIRLDAEPMYSFAQGAPSDRLRFGIIGIGMQGSGLLTNAVTLPNVQCVAACDLYDGRHLLAQQIVGSTTLPTTRRYQDLLNNKEIDCLIVAVPDHWHKQVVVDAVGAGKDVYCEKPMSHTVADGAAMVAAAQKSGRIVQIGSQRTSSALFNKAKQMYDNGAIGEVLSVELTLGRNDPTGAWEYPPPPDLSPQNLDWDTWLGTAPRKAFDPYTFARWRCWKEYGTGVAGDLMVHSLTGMIYTTGMNQFPTRAYAAGGIFRWKDGRNMPDLHTVLFQYGEVPVYVRLTLGTETAEMTRFMGPKGLLEVTEHEIRYVPQSGKDTGPSYYDSGFPHAMKAAYEEKWHEEHDPVPGHEPLDDIQVYTGISYDEVKPHLYNFFEAVRTRKPVVQDTVFGHHAAAACHMANASYFQKSLVTYDAASNMIRT